MKDNGYAGRDSPIGFFTLNEISYPDTHVYIPYILEFEYFINPPHGISIEFANKNRGSVKGKKGIGNALEDYTPKLNYSNLQLSISYKYYFKTYKSAIKAGFIMNKVNIKEVETSFLSDNSVIDSKISWGILIGYIGSLVEKKIFFLRFQTQFRYVFPVEFNNDDLFMNNERIGLSSFFIGMQTGVKIIVNK